MILHIFAQHLNLINHILATYSDSVHSQTENNVYERGIQSDMLQTVIQKCMQA